MPIYFIKEVAEPVIVVGYSPMYFPFLPEQMTNWKKIIGHPIPGGSQNSTK